RRRAGPPRDRRGPPPRASARCQDSRWPPARTPLAAPPPLSRERARTPDGRIRGRAHAAVACPHVPGVPLAWRGSLPSPTRRFGKKIDWRGARATRLRSPRGEGGNEAGVEAAEPPPVRGNVGVERRRGRAGRNRARR